MTKIQWSRYEQHFELPQVGLEGQEKIYASKILIVGVGGLGCPVALYLMAAGVGTIGLIDEDTVDPSNLQRQVLFNNMDLGRRKVDAAKEKLDKLSNGQVVITYPFFLNDANAEEIIKEYDLVIDASDNHIARLIVNKTCLEQDKPWVFGALYHFEGQIMHFNPKEGGPCFKCVFQNLDETSVLPTCKSAGILGPVAGVIGTMQAVEALKLLLGLSAGACGTLTLFNLLTYNFSSIKVARNLKCTACGDYDRLNKVSRASALS